MRKLFTDEIKRKQDNTLNMAFILSQDQNLINALKRASSFESNSKPPFKLLFKKHLHLS